MAMSHFQPYFDAVESESINASFHTCASSVHKPDDYLAIDVSPGEGEKEFTRERKAWHRRRLQDRWRCRVSGHSYCFRDSKESPVHIQLTDANLDEWADKMYTILYPPESIVHYQQSDINSLCPASSRNVMPYDRPFRFQFNPSLTDIRSWRNNLSSDLASSASSGNPGLGYLSGKGIKWIGEQVLDIFSLLEIRRRVWVDKRLIRRMERLSLNEVERLLSRKWKPILRLANDLLELSSDDYKEKYRAVSIKYGERCNAVLWKFISPSDNRRGPLYWLLLSRTALLHFLCEGGGCNNPLLASLREILLQDGESVTGTNWTIPELVQCTCNEIAYGTSSITRHQAFDFLNVLYRMPDGEKEVERLGRPGGVLQTVAEKMLHQGIGDDDEHALAIAFFSVYADDHTEFRHYILGQLTSLVSRLQMHADANERLCYAICYVSRRIWAIPALLQTNISNTLLQVLESSYKPGSQTGKAMYFIMETLHNLVLKEKNSGSLQKESWPFDWMTEHVHKWISEFLEEH